jgi:hypothetical protein
VLKKSSDTQWRIDICNIVVPFRFLAPFVAMRVFIVNNYFKPNPAVEFFNTIGQLQLLGRRGSEQRGFERRHVAGKSPRRTVKVFATLPIIISLFR